MSSYQNDNIFARILRGELPCKKVLENEFVLAFHDIHPQRPVHILVIPKGAYQSMNDFTQKASQAEIAALFKAIADVTETSGIAETGYRVIANCGGRDVLQEVPHLHFHVLGGDKVGPMTIHEKHEI